MTSAPHGGRVAVVPRAAGTQYVTSTGLSDTPPAPEKPTRRQTAASAADAPSVAGTTGPAAPADQSKE